MGMAWSTATTTDHFAFLEDENSIAYNKESRLMFFLPGYDDICGKIQKIYPHAKIFQRPPSGGDGEKSLVSEVEEWMQNVPNSTTAGMVVINQDKLVTVEKLDPYSKLGIKYHFVQLYPYKEDSEAFIPLFYGWFFNLQDSKELRRQACDLLEEVSIKHEFNEEFVKFAMDVSPTDKFNIKDYFSTKTLLLGEMLLHCTGYFTDGNLTPEAKDYHEQSAASFGKALGMEVIGFIITPRTFGVRLKLSDEDLKLWNDERKSKVEDCDKGDLGWKPSKYSPTNGLGSKAHLTLAVREDVQAVQTGLDLEEIIKLEVEDQKTGKDRLTIELTAGVARCYEGGSWAVYLNEYQDVRALFSNFYMK